MNIFLTCPADCDSALVLGAIDVNQDCTNYDQLYSQLCGLVILPNGAADPTDWTAAPAFAAVVDNSIASDTLGKYVVGEGEMQGAEKVADEYPKRQTKVNFRLYTATLTVKNLSDEQYEMLRQLQCGWSGFRFWIETLGERLLGDADGIDPLSVDVDFIYGGGRDDKEQAVITIQFEADGDPERANVPGLAEAIAGVSNAVTVYGPVAGGDAAYGPVAGGDTAYGPIALTS